MKRSRRPYCARMCAALSPTLGILRQLHKTVISGQVHSRRCRRGGTLWCSRPVLFLALACDHHACALGLCPARDVVEAEPEHACLCGRQTTLADTVRMQSLAGFANWHGVWLSGGICVGGHKSGAHCDVGTRSELHCPLDAIPWLKPSAGRLQGPSTHLPSAPRTVRGTHRGGGGRQGWWHEHFRVPRGVHSAIMSWQHGARSTCSTAPQSTVRSSNSCHEWMARASKRSYSCSKEAPVFCTSTLARMRSLNTGERRAKRAEKAAGVCATRTRCTTSG
mmetsp:Transcript_43752/g.114984  ORF Transcript_43752/g.114984 Transcript_43752/m.114984 type:complete len:278 (-) Transcript_43752:635-1468(-)